MDKTIREFVKNFRTQGYSAFEDTEHSSRWGWIFGRGKAEKNFENPFHDKGDGFVFSHLSLFLAMHDYSFPLMGGKAVDLAYTDGNSDGGLDGVAIVLGNEPILDINAIDKALEDDPEAPIRILLLQAKLGPVRSGQGSNSFVTGDEVAGFGTSAEIWLTGTKQDVLARRGKHENLKAQSQWEIYNTLRTSVLASGKAFAPEIILLFSFGDYWNEHDNPSVMFRQSVNNIQHKMPDAVVLGNIWGSQQISAATNHARMGFRRVLHGFNFVELPRVAIPYTYGSTVESPDDNRTRKNKQIQGYEGYISAGQLLKTFSRTRISRANGQAREIEELDYRFFLDNPRFYLRLDKTASSSRKDKWNEGARSLEGSLKAGHSSLVGLGHNGIVIVARKAIKNKDGSFRLVAPQIVNGCQSCFVLNENRDKLYDMFLTLKIIVTNNEKVKDYVIRASNTQTPLDDWSMLARVSELYDLQRAFANGVGYSSDRVWLQRRWNDPLEGQVHWSHVITARELLHCYMSSIQERPHGNTKLLLEKVGTEVFAAGDEPTVYRAVAWLWISVREWLIARHNNKNMQNYPYRYQMVYALWLILENEPEDICISRGVTTQKHFQNLIDRLVADNMTGHLVTLAYQAVKESADKTNSALDYRLVQKASFTALVKRKAEMLRPAVQQPSNEDQNPAPVPPFRDVG